MIFPVRNNAGQECPVSYEHRLLLRLYGDAQKRCSELICKQATEIERSQDEIMRLRGMVIERDTRCWLVQQELTNLHRGASSPGRHRQLIQQIQRLTSLVQDLIRERLRWQWRPQSRSVQSASDATMTDLAQSLAVADLVICQTGCLSHKDYWRVSDVCKRTGKTCVLVVDPDALNRVGLGRKSLLAGPVAINSAQTPPEKSMDR